jgi:hypothetical protein
MIDLGRKVRSPLRHAKQEPQPGHDAVAAADAPTRLRKVQLELANVLGCRRVGRALQKCRESLAPGDAASLRVATELARSCFRSCAGARELTVSVLMGNFCLLWG